jgi:hypothetical protein
LDLPGRNDREPHRVLGVTDCRTSVPSPCAFGTRDGVFELSLNDAPRSLGLGHRHRLPVCGPAVTG